MKFTTLKYLYEIAAIPFEIREEYLQKLLTVQKRELKEKIPPIKKMYVCWD
jgi:hypothetical protein